MKRISSSEDIPPSFRCLYIDDGYRANHGFKDALHSLFYFHNETMNIYTHFIGFICVIILGIDFAMDYFALKHLETEELIALEIYIFCSAGCLLFSTLYHLFGCVSETVHRNLLRLDLTGIAFLVAGSFIPGVYFGKISGLFHSIF
jgi:adiponectin receptor